MSEESSVKSDQENNKKEVKVIGIKSQLGYNSHLPVTKEREENVGIEVNFHLGSQTVVADNADVLDPHLVRFVQALARRAARRDFEASISQ